VGASKTIMGAELLKEESIMNSGNFMSPIKDFMHLDPFRLFPHRLETQPLFTEEWPMKTWSRRAISSRLTKNW